VLFGHSHRLSIKTREGVLFLNPGSAGPRRFNLPVTIARVRVSGPALGNRGAGGLSSAGVRAVRTERWKPSPLAFSGRCFPKMEVDC
jgi:hypothetical protein